MGSRPHPLKRVPVAGNAPGFGRLARWGGATPRPFGQAPLAPPPGLPARSPQGARARLPRRPPLRPVRAHRGRPAPFRAPRSGARGCAAAAGSVGRGRRGPGGSAPAPRRPRPAGSGFSCPGQLPGVPLCGGVTKGTTSNPKNGLVARPVRCASWSYGLFACCCPPTQPASSLQGCREARCSHPIPVLSSLPLDYIVVRLCLSGLPPVLILCCGFDTRPLGGSDIALVGRGPISPALLSSGAPIPRSLSPAPDGRALRASGRAVAPQAAHIFCRLRTAPPTAASLQGRQAGRALGGIADVAVRQAGETSRCVGGQRTVPGAAGSFGQNCAPRGLAMACGAGL